MRVTRWLCASLESCSIMLDYTGFRLSYSPLQKSADRFRYTLPVVAVPRVPRERAYSLDPQLDPEMQQFSTKTYASVHAGYDRGHLVPTSHMSDSQRSRQEANFMTNIIPQASTFNVGLWRKTELLTECYRRESVEVFGGVIYSEKSNDFFIHSHGIKTPDFLWKVIVVRGLAVSFMFPNENNLMSSLSSYMVSVQDIELRLNDGHGAIPIPEEWKVGKGTRGLFRRSQDEETIELLRRYQERGRGLFRRIQEEALLDGFTCPAWKEIDFEGVDGLELLASL